MAQPDIDSNYLKPTVTFLFKRKMRFTFVNALVRPDVFLNTAADGRVRMHPGFFEIPTNNMALYIDGHQASMIYNFNAYRILGVKACITKLQTITLREILPAPPAATVYESASNITSSFQHFTGENVPPYRNRHYVYNVTGVVNAADIDPSPDAVVFASARAESVEFPLPLCQFAAINHEATTRPANPELNGETVAWNRYTTEINVSNEPYELPVYPIEVWRRLRMTWIGELVVPPTTVVHTTWYDQYPYQQRQTNLDDTRSLSIWPGYDFVGLDYRQTNPSYYRHPYQPHAKLDTPNNWGNFIRATPISSSVGHAPNQNEYPPIPMKYYVDVETTIGIEASYGGLFPGTGAGRVDNIPMYSRSDAQVYEPQFFLDDPAAVANKTNSNTFSKVMAKYSKK